MKRVSLVIAASILLQGCAADLGFRVGSSVPSATQPSVGPGGSFSSSGVSARFSQTSSIAAVIGAGILSVLFGREPRGGEVRDPPELDSSRRINEQDCAKPVEGTGNLRCR